MAPHCRAEQSQLQSRKRAFCEQATSVWRVGDGWSHRQGERLTSCHCYHCRDCADHVQRRVTAPGHGGHCASHCIHCTRHSDHCDRDRPAGPESAAAVRQVGLGAEKRGGDDRKIYLPIAWLPPGNDPGAGGGVATLAQQRGRFGLGTFWNEDATSGSREARDQRRDRQRRSGHRLERA
jgi:hypothetical protein